jgi:integrase/recombinase XerD
LRQFFAEHLPGTRGMSPHTVRSYRDSMVLLLRFVATRQKRPVDKLDIEHIDGDTVIDFLQHLENDRANSTTTRNVRLAAVHAFFRYVAARHPDQLEHCQRILGVPFKRARSRPVEYLEHEEIRAVLHVVDRTIPRGRRDYALLAIMFNTGARVQELVALRPCDLQLIRPCHARLLGKGQKERICPLWPQTGKLLQDLIAESKIDARSQEPLFRNHRGRPLTRFGVRYILAKYCDRACKVAPSVQAKRLHPHSMRHSTAIHLLKSGVDLVTISHWLGHASINTTNRYAAVDLDTKRDAISKVEPVDASVPASVSWRTDAGILAWLESL